MTKKSLVLLIVVSALTGCKNHVTRLNTLNQLADKDKQPMRFSRDSASFWLFSIGKIDLMYEVDQDNKWHVKLI